MVPKDTAFYFDQLYPMQDEVLRFVNALDTGFYLSGGTDLRTLGQSLILGR